MNKGMGVISANWYYFYINCADIGHSLGATNVGCLVGLGRKVDLGFAAFFYISWAYSDIPNGW